MSYCRKIYHFFFVFFKYYQEKITEENQKITPSMHQLITFVFRRDATFEMEPRFLAEKKTLKGKGKKHIVKSKNIFLFVQYLKYKPFCFFFLFAVKYRKTRNDSVRFVHGRRPYNTRLARTSERLIRNNRRSRHDSSASNRQLIVF